MTPREMWSNEAQERYVLAIAPARLSGFRTLCERERCPFAVVGIATADGRLEVARPAVRHTPVDMELRDAPRQAAAHDARVRRVPARSCAVPRARDRARRGGAPRAAAPGRRRQDVPGHDRRPHRRRAAARATRWSARGRCRSPTAPPRCCRSKATRARPSRSASARRSRSSTRRRRAAWRWPRRSPTWPRPPVALALARQALGELDGGRRLARRGRGALRHGEGGGARAVPALGVGDPRRQGLAVDAHGLAGRRAGEGGARAAVARRLGLRPVRGRARAPGRRSCGPTRARPSCCSLDLAGGRTGSAARSSRRCSAQTGDEPPDLDDPAPLRALFAALAELRADGLVLAYHDRSDGGLFVDARRDGLRRAHGPARRPRAARGRARPTPRARSLAALFNEELGVVLQMRDRRPRARARDPRAPRASSRCRSARRHADDVRARSPAASASSSPSQRADLQRPGRDQLADADAARQPRDSRCEEYDRDPGRLRPGPRAAARLRPAEDVAAPFVARGARPRVAMLREQGVNGQVEMAAAFDRAGFEAVDVHMSDVIAGRVSLAAFARLRGLRRLLLRRRARRRRGLGQVDPVQPPRARRVRGASSRARTASRSASATAAR